MTTKTSSPSLGTIILVCTVVAAALKVGTMRELSAKPQKMPHGETKQTIVEHQSSLFGAVLGWISLMTFISLLQHQNVTPTIEIEPSLSQNCC